MWDAKWTKNETGIYLACANQLPGTNGQIGIFKYKWPGLTPLAVNEHLIQPCFEVYPIPCHETLYLEVPYEANNGLVRLFDIQGKLIFTQQMFTGMMQMNISALPDGLYVVQYTSKHFSETKKVMILH